MSKPHNVYDDLVEALLKAYNQFDACYHTAKSDDPSYIYKWVMEDAQKGKDDIKAALLKYDPLLSNFDNKK